MRSASDAVLKGRNEGGRRRLVVACPLPKEALEALGISFNITLLPRSERPDPELVLRELAAADALVHTVTLPITEWLVERLPARVGAIGTYSVGHDHINLAACRRRGIAVYNTPDVLSEAVAEVGMLLLLGAARRVGESVALLVSGEWEGWQPTQLNGIGLSGKVLGIVGMGRIGRAIATRARSFGMLIHYLNRSRLPPEVEEGAVFHLEASSLLAISDALVLAAPATAETVGFLDRRRLGLLKRGAIVVNVGRGALVDDDALIEALTSGHVRSAGLDVFNGEPSIDLRYRQLDNVLALPHIGSSTIEARIGMARLLADGIDAGFRGEPAANRID